MPAEHNGQPDRRNQARRATNTRTAAHTATTTEETIAYYGAIAGPVRPGEFRISTSNIDNLPFTTDDSTHNRKTGSKDSKNERIFSGIKNYQIDITLLQETGLNWSQLRREDGWRARAEKYLDRHDMKTRTSHNTNDITGNTQQAGGTAIVTHGKLAHFGMGAGSDSSGLGRWTWAKYRGRNDMKLRCVSIYKPVIPSKRGPKTVWAQHKAYFQAIQDDRCPRIAFMEDLKAEMTKWIAEGDQLIVGGDINTNIKHHTVTTLFGDLNMRNILFEKYGSDNAPTTYLETESDRAVDGLWATPGIHITQGGYLEPGDFPGNHSLIWADITFVSGLGHDPPLPRTPQARRLKLHDSRTTKKYQTNLEAMVIKSRIHSRQIKLEKAARFGEHPTPRAAKEANAIDDQLQIMMMKAEHQCRKLKMGGVSFSAATAGPLRRIDFWETAIRRRKRNKVSSRMFNRKKKKANITMDTSTLSQDDMQELLNKAYVDYRDAKRNHREHRTTFLDTLAPKDRDRLLRVEAQRRLAHASKKVTGKLASKSVTKVEIDGRECTSREEIEDTLLETNHAKVHSSEDTAFLMQPLVGEFGYDLHSDAFDQAHAGTYVPPPETPHYAKILLKGLKRPDLLFPDSFRPRQHISTKDHKSGWRKVKEQISSGMSNRHFGMQKANAEVPILAELDASMRSFAYTTGFSYKRYERGLDVSLLKRKRDYRAKKLRTILLTEPDFNMNNKCIGQDAMRFGERNNLLNPHNYGGRKNLRASEVSMNSTLTCDSIRGRRGRAIICSNDARGCYDRIAHIVVALALMRLGIHKACLQSMLTAIQRMEHHIRTAFGDSEKTYGNDPSETPPQGMLQGNGAAPAGWAAISTVLIDALRDAGFGYKQWSMIRRRAIDITCFAFVDDTDLIHTILDPAIPTTTLIEEAQDLLKLWHGLIRATGGDLHPDKSYWYLLEMEHVNNQWRYKSQEDAPGDLYLTGNPRKIDRHEPSVAQEALGIQTRPDGLMTDQVAYMTEKITEWCDAVRTKRIDREEAWYCFNSTIMKTLEYPLLATSLSRKEVDTLMRPLLRTILPLCGVQSRLPRKLVYGTLKSRGLHVKYPYWTSLIQKLQAIMRHQSRNTPSSDLHVETMELLQVHIGSEIPFWELSYAQYGHLAPLSWMKHAWCALDETPLTFRGPNICIKPSRAWDVHIADHITAMDYSEPQQCSLNDCRLRLGATTLAHIVNAEGTHITPEAWQGLPQPHFLVHWKHWPNTYAPTPAQWTLWRTFLRTAFLDPHEPHRKLSRRLGPWLQNRDSTWRWWLQSNGTLYEHTELDTWRRWSATTGRRTRHSRRHYHNPLECPAPAPAVDIHRVCISRANDTIVAIRGRRGLRTPLPPPTAPTLSATLAALPETAHWALQRITTHDDGNTIAAAIMANAAVAVSDGSLKDIRETPFGTAAYIIQGTDSYNEIVGVNRVPGPINPGDSHRCELAGLYSIMLVVNAICQLHRITSGSITVACDNTQAIDTFDVEFVPNPQSPNFDLVQAIWTLLQESPITWHSQHVKGHQDDIGRRLTRLETLNCAMDLLAKQYWIHLASNPAVSMPPHLPIHGEGWQVWCGNRKIVHPNGNTLYAEIQEPITQLWWVRNRHIPRTAPPLIDWDATQAMMQSLPSANRRYVTKHASHNCGVGTTLVKWKKQDDHNCPRCGERETTAHVIRCNGFNATIEWNKSYTKLQEYLSSHRTDPAIQDAILLGIKQWRARQPIPLAGIPSDIHSTIQQQCNIGWHRFFEGLPAKAWQRRQRQYMHSNRIRMSSRRWIRGVLIHIHHLARNQWRHRNHIKHVLDKPRHRRALKLLKKRVVYEYTLGPDTLTAGDRSMLRLPLVTMLQRTTPFLKSWYTNIRQARLRYIQITHDADATLLQTQTDSAILQWMGGVPR